MKAIKKYKFYIFFFFFSFVTLLVSFFINEDGHGNGGFGDFRDTWGYVQELQNQFVLNVNPIEWTRHFPVHYLLLSFLANIFNDKEAVRFIYYLLGSTVPFIFYKILKLKNKSCDTRIAILLSSLIFFIPAYRYMSIWANAHITATIFFLISIYFLFKYQDSKTKNLYYLLLHVCFIYLTAYTIQYYAIFGLFFFIFYFKFNFSKENFLLFFFITILAIPGLYFIYKYPAHFNSIQTNFLISNVILSNTAMLSLYLTPIILINLIYNKRIFMGRATIISFFASISLTIFLVLFFDANQWHIGGGIPYALSTIIFNNLIFFYICSFLSTFFLILLAHENLNNFLLVAISVFIFSSSSLYQRYYEPFFYIILFLLFNTKFLTIFKEKITPCIFLLIYYIMYYLGASSEILYF